VQPKRLKFIGCEIMYREACTLAAVAPHRVDVEFLIKGLHDLETPDMVRQVQERVDTASDNGTYEAILLGYGRCNDGLVGVRARQIPLVLPRAHDCITLFFGGRKAFEAYFSANPGTWFMTTGWLERNQTGGPERPDGGQTGVMAKLGLADSYEQMVAKYGEENAAFIAESMGGWVGEYTRALYLKMGVCDEQARQDATDHGWEFELRDGDLGLLRKLFFGQWDEDFVIVEPGGVIVARNDAEVLDSKGSG